MDFFPSGSFVLRANLEWLHARGLHSVWIMQRRGKQLPGYKYWSATQCDLRCECVFEPITRCMDRLHSTNNLYRALEGAGIQMTDYKRFSLVLLLFLSCSAGQAFAETPEDELDEKQVFGSSDAELANGPDAEENGDGYQFYLSDSLRARFGLTAESEWSRRQDSDGNRADTHIMQATPSLELVFDDWLALAGALEVEKEKENLIEDDVRSTLMNSQVVVDELFLSASKEDQGGVYAKLGYYTAPFGDFDSAHSVAPLAEEAFEMKGDTVEFGYLDDVAFYNVYAFRARRNWVIEQYHGEVDEPQDQHWHWGAGAARNFAIDDGNVGFKFWITDNIYGSSELIYDVAGRDGALGAGAGLEIEYGGNKLTALYIGSIEEFEIIPEGATEGRNSRPSAFSVELSGEHEFDNVDGLYALSYSRTWHLNEVLPQERVIATVGLGFDHFKLLLETGFEWEYEDEDGTRSNAQFASAKVVFEY